MSSSYHNYVQEPNLEREREGGLLHMYFPLIHQDKILEIICKPEVIAFS